MAWIKSFPERTYYAFLFTEEFDVMESPVLGGNTGSGTPTTFYTNGDSGNPDVWQYTSGGFNYPVIRRQIVGFPTEAYRTVALAADPAYPNTQYRLNVYSIDPITPQEVPILVAEARTSDGTLLESLEWQYLDGGLEFDNTQAFSVTDNIAYIVITFNRPPGGDPLDVGVELEELEGSVGLEVVAEDDTYTVAANSTAQPMNVYENDTIGGNPAEDYNDPWGTEIFTAPTHGTITRLDNISFRYTPDPGYSGSDSFVYTLSAYDPEIEDFVTDNAMVSITVEGGAPTDPFKVITNRSSDVYELDRGDSFDGMYIPHMLELNYYYGDSPIQFTSVQKMRAHGLSRGYANLQLSMNGMDSDYEEHYTEPQYFQLPLNMKYVSEKMDPHTSMVDTAVRGLSVQIKIEGNPKQLSFIGAVEPGHALQAVILRAGPGGTTDY